MTCVQLAEPDVDQALAEEPCSWSSIAAAVRIRASELETEAADLLEWADFLDGLGELESQGD